MDLTVFLFNSRLQLRKVISRGISTLIHGERSHTLAATIPTLHEAKPGEYLGFRCADGRFRLFCIEYADRDDTDGTTDITAKDAAVDELDGTIITRAESESISGSDAVSAIADAVGFAIGVNEAGDKTASAKGGMMSAWAALTDAESAYNLFMEPYYTFDGAKITGKVIDVLARKPVYRGRFVESGSDGESIAISWQGRPKPKIYGVGADGLTFADVVWATDDGDPADKPAGQTWIGVPEAVEKYRGRGQTYELTDVTDADELLRRSWEKAQEAAEPSLTATATISDMEMIAGQTWKSIRLWDQVRVRPKFGGDVLEQVIDIERNYVYPEQTKITLGKEADSTAKQVKSLMKSSAALSSRVGGVSRGLAQTQTLLEDTSVRLYELDGYTRTEINNVSIRLSAQEAEIMLKASQEDLSEVDRRLSQAEIRIDGAEAEILLKASQTEVAGLQEDVSAAEIRIDGLESEIELKADKITLNGYVTASQLETEFSNFESGISDSLYVKALSCSGFSCSSFSLNGYGMSTKSVTVLTSGTTLEVTATGGTVTGVTLNKKTDTLYYWSWE